MRPLMQVRWLAVLGVTWAVLCLSPASAQDKINCGTGSGAADCKAPEPFGHYECDHSTDKPITEIADVFGIWTNDAGEKITLRPQIGGKSSELVWDGKQSWRGSFAKGKLNFKRNPKPAEMGAAPEWARKLAALPEVTNKGPTMALGGSGGGGTTYVQWELDLEAKLECGQPVITGKWYPGAFKWSEELDTDGNAIESSRQVTDVSRGTPVELRYAKQPPAIVDVAVLENQTREDALGKPYYMYPFQDGADDTGAALSTRTLLVYGIDLPKTRDGRITVTSEDPHIDYLVLAVRRDWESSPGLEERVNLGRQVAKAEHRPEFAPEIDKMDAVLLRATLKRGVLPGMKGFKLNDGGASWPLIFGDGVAHVSFARAGNGTVAPPGDLKPSNVISTQYLFKPERTFIEVRTEAPFPLNSITLKVGVRNGPGGYLPVTWNGNATIVANLVRGSTTVYRTPAIELIAPGAIPADQAGAYFLPTDGESVLATVADPWQFRTDPGAARLLSQPGDLGHTFHYYLRRAAIVDKLDPLPDLSTLDGWRQLSGKKATTLTNIAVLSGYLWPKKKPKTWQRELLEQHLKVRYPLLYLAVRADDTIQEVDVSVAEHAALLFFRDTFLTQMNQAIAKLQAVIDDYKRNPNSASLRGTRDYLKAFGWDDAVFRLVKIDCPGSFADCSLPYALSDAFLKQAFPKDKDAADRWSLAATAQGLKNLIDAATEARDKAKGLAETDVEGMLKILGRNYEPLLASISGRLMIQDENGKWIPDLAALYSLKELHQLTDAMVAQEELARADRITILKLAMAAAVLTATPALIAEEAVAATTVSWGLFGTNAVGDVAEAYFNLPDVKFAFGATLVLGAEQLSAAQAKSDIIFYQTLSTLIVSGVVNGGAEALGPILSVSKSAAEIVGRPAVQVVKRGGLAAFKKLPASVQRSLLAIMLRAKAAQQSVKEFLTADLFAKDAVEAADRLAQEAGVPPPKPVEEAPVAAKGNPAAKPTELAAEKPTGESTIKLGDPDLPPTANPETVKLGDPDLPPDADFVVLTDEELALAKKPPPVPDPAKQGTQSAGQLSADEAAALNNAWSGAPEGNSEITLTTSANASAEPYVLGNRVGKPGTYVWALELESVGGRAVDRPTVLKLAGRNVDEFFTGAEMVENSEIGYLLVTERTRIRVLKTEFHPGGVETFVSGKTRPAPFMTQEALGKRRMTLSAWKKQFGEFPENVQISFAKMKAELKRAGLFAEDLNRGNIYIEALDPKVSWANIGQAQIDLGLLDFDRIVLWDDLIAHRCGKMGRFLTEVTQIDFGPKRIASMATVYSTPSNVRFMNLLRSMRKNKPAAYQKLLDLGPYWQDDLDYALGKMLEYHGYVKFAPSETGGLGSIVKGDIDPKYFDGILQLNDSSRFTSFPLSARVPPQASTGQLRRRRPGSSRAVSIASHRRRRPGPRRLPLAMAQGGMMRVLLPGAAVLMLAAPLGVACADSFADQVTALTGSDTPESEAVDREVEDLILEYQKADAKFIAEPVGPAKAKLLAEAEKIRGQALERARAAGTLRAEAANRERCLAPDAGGAATGGGATSSYLCGAVSDAVAGETPNDPWMVCGCARRYLEGLRGEVEAISERAQGFAGQSWPTETQWSVDFQFRRSAPLAAETVSAYFDSDLFPASDRHIGRIGPRGTIGGDGGWSFLVLAEQAQQRIAQLSVYERTTSVTGQVAFANPMQHEHALLIPPKRDAYFRVQEALRWAWLLYQREGALKMAAIEEQLVEAVEKAERPYHERMGAVRTAIHADENRSWLDRHADDREADRKSCPSWVANLMPQVEEAIASARSVAAEVYKARRRFLADAEAWKVFGLKDGAGTGPTPGSGQEFNDQEFAQFILETLGLSPLPFGSGLGNDPLIGSRLETGWTFWLPAPVSQEVFGPYCMWPGFFLSDPIAGYWQPVDLDGPYADPSYGYWNGADGDQAATYDAMVLKAAQARFPEMEEIGGHGGPAWLRFDLETKGQVSEAVVSGAGVGQGP